MKVRQSSATIREIRPLPLLALPPSLDASTTTNIVIGQTIIVSPAQAEADPEFKPLKVATRISPFLGAAGTLAFTADKVAAMPMPQLAHQLQQTPGFQLTDQSANTVAENLKTVAASTLGRYLVVGVAGGTLAVGVAYALKPKLSAGKLATVFVVAAVVIVAAVYMLSRYGVVVPTPASKP